jgi:hypothetical protein
VKAIDDTQPRDARRSQSVRLDNASASTLPDRLVLDVRFDETDAEPNLS